MLGIVEDVEKHVTNPKFKKDGDIIYYIGADRKGIGGSEYLHTIHGLTTGDAPELDLEFEQKLQDQILNLIKSLIENAAHDISDDRLAITLAEMALLSGKGASVSLEGLRRSSIEKLYTDAQSDVVENLHADKDHKFQK